MARCSSASIPLHHTKHRRCTPTHTPPWPHCAHPHPGDSQVLAKNMFLRKAVVQNNQLENLHREEPIGTGAIRQDLGYRINYWAGHADNASGKTRPVKLFQNLPVHGERPEPAPPCFEFMFPSTGPSHLAPDSPEEQTSSVSQLSASPSKTLQPPQQAPATQGGPRSSTPRRQYRFRLLESAANLIHERWGEGGPAARKANPWPCNCDQSQKKGKGRRNHAEQCYKVHDLGCLWPARACFLPRTLPLSPPGVSPLADSLVCRQWHC